MKNATKRASGKRRKTRARRAGGCTFESLEFRQLMATVNVASFGATINDGTDDRSAIQRAISASAPGDTILFSDGVYNLSNEITLATDRNYVGQNGATLKGEGLEGHLLKVQGNNITIKGLTLNGGGVFIEKTGGGRNQNIAIDSNTFQMTTTRLHKSAIIFTSGLDNSKITNNYLTGFNGGFAMYGYNYMGLTIANNEIVNMAAGMHIDAFGGSGNLLVEQNYISGTKGMGMEFQGSASNLIFQDNWYEKPAFTSLAGSASGNTMAYSLILDKSTNITIRRNVMIAPRKGSTGDYVRINFEVGGDNTLVTDNFTDGGNHVVAVNDGVGTASVTVRDNRFQNFAQGISNTFASALRTLININNTATTRLSDTMESRLAAGQRPGIGIKRYGQSTTTPATTPTPLPTPTPTPSKVTIGKEAGVTYLSDMAYADAKNAWGPVERDQSLGEDAAGDGAAITIGNRVYTKGLGVHAHSEVRYNLNGGYTTFQSDIGIDAESGANGSVVFEVWVDGAKVYTSGMMTPASGYKTVNVDVTGKRELTLIVTNGGDNIHYDHADWANARLTPASLPPVTNPQPQPGESSGSFVHLSDMVWISSINGMGPVERDRSVGGSLLGDGGALSINGTTYEKGLGVHATSAVRVALSGKYATFSSVIGLDDTSAGKGAVMYHVLADGKVLFTSGLTTAASGARAIDLDVRGVQELMLIVSNGSTIGTYDKANWANAKLTLANAETPLSSVPYTVVRNGWGPAEVNKSNGERFAGDGALLTLNGVVYGDGLGVHAPSDIVVNLNGQYTRFVSEIGLDDSVGIEGSVTFQVYGDGFLLFDSGVMTGASATKTVDVGVAGIQQLTLKVNSPTSNIDNDHANWAGASLVRAG